MATFLAELSAGYARYSTQKQDGGVTIEAQDKHIRALALQRGWPYSKTYADEGVSGAVPVEERPGLVELMDEAKAGRVGRVITYDASRLARDQHIFWSVVSELKLAGVIFVTVVMPDIDSTKPEFEIIGGTLQGMASYERQMVKKKTKDAMEILKEKGKARGRPRLGFTIGEEGYFEPDTLGARVLESYVQNPKMKASVLAQLMGLDYYDAWTVLKNVRLYMAEKKPQ